MPLRRLPVTRPACRPGPHPLAYVDLYLRFDRPTEKASASPTRSLAAMFAASACQPMNPASPPGDRLHLQVTTPSVSISLSVLELGPAH